MVWSGLSSLVFGLLALHFSVANGQSSPVTPWSSPDMAQSFMSSFLQAASNSGLFTASQVNDMSDVGETIIDSMQRLARSGKSSYHKMQALNTAFASSVADIAVTESTGDIGMVTDAIRNCMSQAFLQTTGVVNDVFVNEITRLVGMFAQNSAASYSGGIPQSYQAASKQQQQRPSEMPNSYQTSYLQQQQNRAAVAQSFQTSYPQQQQRSAEVQQSYQTSYSQQPQQQSFEVPQSYQASNSQQQQSTAPSTNFRINANVAENRPRPDFGVNAVDGRYVPGFSAGTEVGIGGRTTAANSGLVTRTSTFGYFPSNDVAAGPGNTANTFGAMAAPTTEVLNSANRLTSQASASRVSSAVYNMVSNGAFNSGALSQVISSLSSSIRAENPQLSGCEATVQALLEVMTALTQIVSSSSIGPVNTGASSDYASMVGQQISGVFN